MSSGEQARAGHPSHGFEARTATSGFLFGVGLAAFVDEVVFHQLLHWHHFYDKATTDAGLVSDGILHAFGWAATVAGLFLLADLRRRRNVAWTGWWGSVLAGAGLFQLYDGFVHHKLLGLHQIRYNVDLLPYDLTWNAIGALMIVVGIAMVQLARTRRGAGTGAPAAPGSAAGA
jgi:uncharacterized membrane protein